METMYGPEFNDGKTIFVFGSNLAGRHGMGAALCARRHWGATPGKGGSKGRDGQAYAIPTKDNGLTTLPLFRIKDYVRDFIDYVRSREHLTFLVTRVGCGLAGYEDHEIAPLFREVKDFQNVVLPKEWLQTYKEESNESS